MSQSIRFLGVAVLAWAGIRAVSLGLVPGTQALAFDAPPPASAATIPATRFPPIEPPVSSAPSPGQMAPGQMAPGQMATGYGGYPAYPPPYGMPYGAYPPQPVYAPYPVYGPVQPAAYRQSAPRPSGRASRRDYVEQPAEQYADNPYFEPVAPLDEWSGIKLAAAAPVPGPRSTPRLADGPPPCPAASTDCRSAPGR